MDSPNKKSRGGSHSILQGLYDNTFHQTIESNAYGLPTLSVTSNWLEILEERNSLIEGSMCITEKTNM